MTAPLRVSVMLSVEGEHVMPGKERDFWVEDHIVERVDWFAHAIGSGGSGPKSVTPGSHEPIVSVTLHTRRAGSRTWYRPSASLTVGLTTGTPPEWVPTPPEWFEAAIEQMRAEAGVRS